MKTYFPFILSIIVLLVLGCDEVIELDPQQNPPILVIEGVLADNPDLNYVRLSTTIDFYDTMAPPPVRNAVVTVVGDEGSTLSFSNYNGSDEDSLGFYLPDTTFEAVPFVNYELRVEYQNEVYLATDRMQPAPEIDSLSSAYDYAHADHDHEGDRVYQVFVYTTEPKETKDYYMFRFYRNGERERRFDADIYLADDIALSNLITGVPVPFHYAKDDTAKVEIFNISRKAYVYYTDLTFILGNDGGMFSPPPANPKTNINNGALGYFLVSSVSSDTIIVK